MGEKGQRRPMPPDPGEGVFREGFSETPRKPNEKSPPLQARRFHKELTGLLCAPDWHSSVVQISHGEEGIKQLFRSKCPKAMHTIIMAISERHDTLSLPYIRP